MYETYICICDMIIEMDIIISYHWFQFLIYNELIILNILLLVSEMITIEFY